MQTFVLLSQRIMVCYIGNYLPALEAVRDILQPDKGNSTCSIMILFLSDGKPSDRYFQAGRQPFADSEFSAESSIYESVQRFGKDFGRQLTFASVGFGNSRDDFRVLRRMADESNSSGASGLFFHSTLSADSLSKVMSTLSASHSSTMAQTTLQLSSSRRTLRQVEQEQLVPPVPAHLLPVVPSMLSAAAPRFYSSSDLKLVLEPADWNFCEINVQRCVWDLKRRKWTYDDPSPKNGVAIKKKSFGCGAERVVFHFREFQTQPGSVVRVSVGAAKVAKETKYVEDEFMKMKFHEIFCRTQATASALATQFNLKVKF
jgi:hypothetical protein